MRPPTILLPATLSLLLGAASLPAADATAKPTTEETKLSYPDAAKSDHVDEYHGVKIPDPYRWLEDPDSPASRQWIEAENRLTFGYLEKIPQREAIRKRLTALWNYERFGMPRRRGSRYFYSRNDGLQNQSVLYVTDSLGEPGRVLLDPNKLSADGTVALGGYAISDDGSLLAYGLAAAGSDWQTWHVRDVDTGEDLEDELRWVKFSGASWTPDNKGFYYSRYDAPKEGEKLTGLNYYQKLYYHRLGEPQDKDTLVYQRPDEKEWGFDGEVTDDGRYLVISIWRGTERKNLVYYRDLQQPEAKIVELINDWDAQYGFIDNIDSTFYFRSDYQAPRYRVLAVDLDKPQRENWRDVIAASDNVLQSANLVGGMFFARYLQDALSQVQVFDTAGKLQREVKLPGLGSVGGFGGRRDDTETFYSFTSYTTPGTIYRYDIASGRSSIWRTPKVDFDPARYVSRQVFYTSKDGTRIPMILTHHKDIEPGGKLPTYLYAYGGFNISLSPGFSPSSLVWMEMGGLLAVPNLRGGGEYGRAWHEAGMMSHKQNVFDDFIAAAEWLIANKYTDHDHLAIAGGSNGGLLVGACLTQRPDLYGACLPAVGVMDMLRFHKFTIGWAWVSEYGSSDDAEQFAYLRGYSPLHNIKPGTRYPATLITTADHDDRVVPAHSFKFAATLQAAQAGPEPILIRIETKAGHGAGKPTAKVIEEAADKWAFLVSVFEMRPELKDEGGRRKEEGAARK